MDAELHKAAEVVASVARGAGWVVAAAESVTAGGIATALAAAPDASEWFAGSLVAYRTATKREVLGVSAERIISAECAQQLVAGVLDLTGADAAVAVTGVGGPDDEEGREAGTVYIAAGTRDDQRVTEHRFGGGPEDVIQASTLHALRLLASLGDQSGS